MYTILYMIIKILGAIQIIFSIALIVTVLLQQKGSGLGAAFGGGGGGVQTTRRGADKFLYRSTIVISILFFGTAIAGILL
jgi:preprotein translocase subunit SecG